MKHGIKFKRLAESILSTLTKEGKSFGQIAIECDVKESKLRNYIGYLREKRLIYIAGWIKLSTSQRPVALYKFGCQDDVEHIRRAYKKKNLDKPYKHSKWPRCDEAAAWMLNPIIKDQPCQT